MYRPDLNYDCYIGVYDPVDKTFDPSKKYANDFSKVDTTPEDASGCLGCSDIYTFDMANNSPKALLIARPFRENSIAIVEHSVNGVMTVTTYNLYSATLETPRFIWLPANVHRVAFNIRVEDMGYEPSWYEQDEPIPYSEPTNQDFINMLNLYFMYEANPYYDKLQVNKEPDTQNAPTGRFLRDKIQTDLTFRGDDYQRILGLQRESENFIDASITEYAIVAVAFWERFEDDNQQDYMAACMCFNRADAEVNFSERYVQPKLKPLDNYTWLLDKYNTKKNIVGLNIEKTELTLPLPYIIQLYVIGSSTVTNICGDTCWEQEVEPVGDDTIYSRYCFNPIKDTKLEAEIPNFKAAMDGHRIVARLLGGTTGNWNLHFAPIDTKYYHVENLGYVQGNDYDGSTVEYFYVSNYQQFPDDSYLNLGVMHVGDYGTYYRAVRWFSLGDLLGFQETNKYTAKPTEYGIYQPNQYYTNDGLACDGGLYGVKPMPTFMTDWGEYSCWVSLMETSIGHFHDSNLTGFLTTLRRHWITKKDCFSVHNVIKALLKEYGLSYNFSDTPVSSNLLYNSGKLNYLGINDLLLIPATNITRGRYTQAAQKMELSLKDILDELCGVCNAGWHIDHTGLHLEGNEYYDAGHTYNGVNYNSQLDFETIVDEFNDTNTLYGQIASSPDTSNMWHTLTMNGADKATKHFKQTEMQAKAPYLSKDKSLSPVFAYDLMRAVIIGDIDDDGVICVGCNFKNSATPNDGKRETGVTIRWSVEGKARSTAAPIQQMVLMNEAFSWPFLKGRFMYGLPADRTLIEWGWIARQYWTTAMGGAKAYTAPHRSIKIHLPIVSELYTQNWQLVKTTLGYGTVRKIDIDMVARVADVTVDIIEYNI